MSHETKGSLDGYPVPFLQPGRAQDSGGLGQSPRHTLRQTMTSNRDDCRVECEPKQSIAFPRLIKKTSHEED
jgi:hypothetical protein